MDSILYDYTELPKNVFKFLLKTTLKIYSETTENVVNLSKHKYF